MRSQPRFTGPMTDLPCLRFLLALLAVLTAAWICCGVRSLLELLSRTGWLDGRSKAAACFQRLAENEHTQLSAGAGQPDEVAGCKLRQDRVFQHRLDIRVQQSRHQSRSSVLHGINSR